MRRESGTMLRLAVPARALVQRFAYVLLLAASFSLLVLGRAETEFVERVRINVTNAVSPVLNVLSQPIGSFNAAVDEISTLFVLYAENARLREENARLHKWQDVARRLEQENLALKSLVRLADEPRMDFISGRVIGDSGGAFVRTLLVNAGSLDGVRKAQAVMTAKGLVGRVVEVGEDVARILLITDLNSRVPVVIESTRERGVLAGDNSPNPALVFLPANVQVAQGDRIITSGHGGLFPPGVPVGTVKSVVEGEVRVAPFVDWHRVAYVRILDYAHERLRLQPLVAASE